MRGFVGGRTECLRPVTSQAVAFAEALRDGAATAAQLEAMLAAHRAQVKACKSGDGFDRHLLGLQASAERLGLEDPFFSNADLAALRRDLLGTPEQVIDYVFAPTVPEGFGVCYTPYPDALGFVVTYNEATAKAPEAFLAALEKSAELLRNFLRSLA
jgi:carnitine O-acetyltransferase